MADGMTGNAGSVRCCLSFSFVMSITACSVRLSQKRSIWPQQRLCDFFVILLSFGLVIFLSFLNSTCHCSVIFLSFFCHLCCHFCVFFCHLICLFLSFALSFFLSRFSLISHFFHLFSLFLFIFSLVSFTF